MRNPKAVKLKSSIVKFTRFALLLFAFAALANAAAHRFHSSLTRMDYNAAEKNIEISIQLFTHDLVPVLEKEAKKNIDLEKTKDVDAIILKYLESKFVLKNKKGETLKLKWVGKEVLSDTVNVYVEIPSAESFDGYMLQNHLFFETFPRQVNLVVMRFDEKKADLYFKAGDTEKKINETILTGKK